MSVRQLSLLGRAHPYDHHYALLSLFEIMDVAARQDLKSEMLKELERQRQQFLAYRGNPAVSEQTLDVVLGEIEAASRP